MSRNRFCMVALVLALSLSPARGTPPAAPGSADPQVALGMLGGTKTDALAGSLRGYLIRALPDPLYVDERHWGLQKEVTRGLKWKGQGIHVHAEKQKKLKNDGHWWKVRVTAPGLRDSLVLDLREMQQAGPGRMTFTAFLSFDARVEYDRQHWRAGVRLRSGSARARLRVKLTLRCEVTARLESGGGLVPDMVFRLRVLQSDFRYDNLVVEHIAGVGGDAAKALGNAVINGMRQWHPSLERNLLDRANAAVVKAGDTREVRVSLLSLFGKK